MRTKKSRGLVTTLICGVVAACSGAVDDGVGTPDAFAQSYCAIFTPCCDRLNVARTKPSCDTMTLSRMRGGPYDAKQAHACIAAMRAQQSRGDFCATAGDFAARAACFPVLEAIASGSAQPGEACATIRDCAQSPDAMQVDCFTDANAVPAGTPAPSTCVFELVGKVGDAPCIGTIDGTSAGFSWSSRTFGPVPAKAYVCDPANGSTCDGGTQRCVPIGQPGAPPPMTPTQSSDLWALCGR